MCVKKKILIRTVSYRTKATTNYLLVNYLLPDPKEHLYNVRDTIFKFILFVLQ